MDGPMSGVNPDDVENDVGNFWRTLYKMEKNFSENPNPLKMASKVRSGREGCIHTQIKCTSTFPLLSPSPPNFSPQPQPHLHLLILLFKLTLSLKFPPYPPI